MKLHMTKSHFRLTTKLLLINLVFLAVVGGILAVVFIASHKTERAMTTIATRNIKQVVEDTRLGEDLTSVFADLLMGMFHGEEEAVQELLVQFEEKIGSLMTEEENVPLQEPFQQFLEELSTLLERSAQLNDFSQTFRELEEEFFFQLDMLGDILEELIEEKEEDTLRAQHLHQLQAMNVAYRESFFQITTNVAEYRHTGIHQADASDVPPGQTIEDLLKHLLLRLQNIGAAEPEIAEQGEILIQLVNEYAKQVTLFRQARMDFQARFQTSAEAKNSVMTLLAARNEQVAQSTGSIVEQITGKIQNARRIIWLLAGSLFLLLVFTTFSATNMVKPLISLAEAARRIAQGDVHVQLPKIRARDEVGVLITEFGNMTTYMQEMSAEATRIASGDLRQNIMPRSERDALGNAFQNMSAYLQEVASIATAMAEGDLRQEFEPKSEHDVLGNAFHQLTSLRQTIGKIIEGAEQLGEASEQLSQISLQMASGAEQNAQQARLVSENSQGIADNVGEISAASEELVSTSREVSSNITTVGESIESAVKIVNTANAINRRFELSSQEIGEITQVIAAITQQTNLLALNAAIEAARVGDAGKGFAVVANEVKELARETAYSAEGISKKIEAIQHNSEKTGEVIVKMTSIIQHIYDMNRFIASAVEQQRATTTEISRNIFEVARGSEEITQAIDEVAGVAEQASEHSASVQEASLHLNKLAVQLRKLVEKFII